MTYLMSFKVLFLSLMLTFLTPWEETLCASQPWVSITDSEEQFY